MRKLILLCVLAAVLPAVYLPAEALAQTETDARQLFERGNAHLERGLRSRGSTRTAALREALNQYHQALRITRSRSVLFNIGVCYQHLRRYQDAYSYFSEYLRLEDLADADRAEAERHLAVITPHVALVEVASQPPGATVYVDRRDLSPRGVAPLTVAIAPGPRRIIAVLDGHDPGEAPVEAELGQTHDVSIALTAHPSRLHIETDPPGAEVRIDDENGEVLGTTPLDTTVTPGEHRIYATLGDRAGREVINALPGGARTVEVMLAAPTTPGDVDVIVDVHGAVVSVDGERVGVAPIRGLRLTPGSHRITVSGGEGFEPWSEMVEVGPGHRLDMRVHLGSSTLVRRFGPWPNVGMVTAVVLGIAAAATGGWALSMHSDFEEIRTTCTELPQACAEGTVMREEARTLEESIRGFAIATDVLIGTASAIAIVSFALMLLNREVEDASRVRFAVSPVEGGAFASLDLGGIIGMAP